MMAIQVVLMLLGGALGLASAWLPISRVGLLASFTGALLVGCGFVVRQIEKRQRMKKMQDQIARTKAANAELFGKRWP
jgi:hypothetical protein